MKNNSVGVFSHENNIKIAGSTIDIALKEASKCIKDWNN